MGRARIECCVFDAYGTLFDVHSAVAAHTGPLGGSAAALSELWRAKQLEYSWVRSLANRHADFWTLTCEALDHALAAHAIDVPGLRDALLRSYRSLAVYHEVTDMLAKLRSRGVGTAILSNGSPGMLDDAVSAAGIADLFDAVLSIEEVGIYKPSPAAYALATDRLGLLPNQVLFLSSNARDAMGARSFGFDVRWVNRTGRPPEYGLTGVVAAIPTLESLPDLVARLRQSPAATSERRSA